MKYKKTSWNMVMMMAAIMAVGFLMNLIIILPHQKNEHFIGRGWVKSISIISDQKSYQAGLVQQGEIVRLLNQSTCVDALNADEIQNLQDQNDIKKLVIHRFSRGDIALMPIGLIDNKLVFTVVGWDKDACLIENQCGEFHKILATSTP